MFSVASFDHITMPVLSLITTPLLTLFATRDNCSSSAIISFCSLISLPLAYHLSFFTATAHPIHFAVPSFNLIRASTSKFFFPADSPSENRGINNLRSSSSKKSQIGCPAPSSGVYPSNFSTALLTTTMVPSLSMMHCSSAELLNMVLISSCLLIRSLSSRLFFLASRCATTSLARSVNTCISSSVMLPGLVSIIARVPSGCPSGDERGAPA